MVSQCAMFDPPVDLFQSALASNGRDLFLGDTGFICIYKVGLGSWGELLKLIKRLHLPRSRLKYKSILAKRSYSPPLLRRMVKTTPFCSK